MLPRIAITIGDPGGIGPEVVVKALADESLRSRARFTVVGVSAPLYEAAEAAGVQWPLPGVQPLMLPSTSGSFGRFHNEEAGDLSFRFVEEAIEAAKLSSEDPRHVDAVVTGPISKEAWAMAGHLYPGHTELFAERFGVEHFGMMFYAPPSGSAPSLNVILVTTHIPISKVPAAITKERIKQTINLAVIALRQLGDKAPRIAVCGLNPHAGENGLIGSEDRDVIAPAVAELRREGVDVHGPLPGDTVFAKALHGPGLNPSFDIVVAMYHDQGLAPVKLIARDRTVNLTVGLPTIRTSPDHGTAFDIAGRNMADAGSMKAAIDLAIRRARSGR